jgi:hypothetical protein
LTHGTTYTFSNSNSLITQFNKITNNSENGTTPEN